MGSVSKILKLSLYFQATLLTIRVEINDCLYIFKWLCLQSLLKLSLCFQSYTMRNSVLGAIGEMVVRILSHDDLDSKQKLTRDQFLDKLEVGRLCEACKFSWFIEA